MNIIKKIKLCILNLHNYLINKKSNITSKIIPHIITRAEHNISRKNIHKNILHILYKLKDSGYKSYLVGGGVRDLLLNRTPKDFDVVTNAYPEKIRKLFKYCYIIGRRFQLVHVHSGKDIVEVVTFRGKHAHPKNHSKEGMILRDNIYGTIEEDAMRRDFTVNALYYNIADYSIVDYAGGLKDLHAKKLRLIGDPATRYREDPVRMLRAVRFAAKLGFTIEDDTAAQIYVLKELLLNVAPARLYEEYVKLFFYGHAVESFKLLKHYGLLAILFPRAKHYNNINNKFIMQGLKDLDCKIQVSKNYTVNDPAWVVALLLWNEVKTAALEYNGAIKEKRSEFLAYKCAAEQILSEQNKIIVFSKKIAMVIKDLWTMQSKLAKIAGKPAKKVETLRGSIKFNTAFEFLLLRASAGDPKARRIAAWWNKYILATKIVLS